MTDGALTTTDLARELGLHDSTVRALIREERITPDWRTPGQHARFYPKSVARIRKRLRMIMQKRAA